MKKIHIINIEPDGTKVALKTLKSDQFEKCTLKKLEDFINDKNFFTGGESIVLDEQTQKDIIIFYTKKNYQINWFIEFNKIKIKNYFLALNRREIFFYAVGGYGSTDGFSWLIFLFKIIKGFFSLLKNFYKIFKYLSYKTMENHTGRSKKFIIDIINSDEKWKRGFITSGNLKFKKFIEFFIMKDLGYKIKNGIWMGSSK